MTVVDPSSLKTPNFAMDTSDAIIPENEAASEQQRYTAHAFHTDPNHVSAMLGSRSSGAPVRLPENENRWPPRVIFDVVYAAAVLKLFGTRLDDDRTAWASWASGHYPRLASRAAADFIESQKDKQEKTDDRRKHDTDRAQRLQKRNGGANEYWADRYDPLTFYWSFIPQDQVDAYIEKTMEEAAMKAREQAKQKVASWQESMTT